MIVRIYTHSGFVAHPLPDNSHLLVYPYLGAETIAVIGGEPAKTSDAENAPAATRLARIEIDGGDRVHFEVTPWVNCEPRAAGPNSPTIGHGDLLAWGHGYRISVWGPEL